MRLLLSVFCLLGLAFFANAQDRYNLVKYPDLEGQITVYDLLVKDNGSVYLATDKGLYYISSFESAPKEIIGGKRITALCESPDNSFFFGGDNFFGNSSNFEMNYLKESNASIRSMALYNNSLWIGTDIGLYEVNRRNFSASKLYTVRNSRLPDPQVNFIYPDRHDILWVGTKNGVLRINGENWKSYERSSMEGIFENREGLWLLSADELWNIDNVDKYNRWYRANLQDGLKKGSVNDIVVDSEDRLIIASDILVRFDPYSDRIERYGDELGLVSQKCLAIEIDEDDKLWIGTEKEGLYTVGFRQREKTKKDKVPMEFALIGKAPSCHDVSDGSVKLNIKGGKPPYQIRWSTGEENVKQIYKLHAGQYRVTVIDAEPDTLSDRITLIQPRPLTIEITDLDIDAFGEGNSIATFLFDGGNPGYILDIDGENRNNPATNIPAGNHVATVTDIMGCKASLEFRIEGETNFSQIDASSIEVGQVVRIDNLYFDTDSTQVSANAFPVLDEVYQFLMNNPKIVIEIGGHTNGLPPHDYCDRLSTERAKNVAEHLINRGIPTERITYRGYGKRVPIASNKTSDGRKRNQRVEIKVLSLGS